MVSLEHALTKVKTGDLVVCRSRYGALDLPVRIVSPVTHIGMVVRDHSGARVVETHAAGDTKQLGVTESGVHAYPLDQRIRTYEGQVYLCQMTSRLNAQQERALRKALMDLKDVPFESNYRNHFITRCFIGRRQPTGQPREAMFCSEYLALAMVHAGLLPPDTITECMSPSSLLDLRVNDYPLFTNLVRVK